MQTTMHDLPQTRMDLSQNVEESVQETRGNRGRNAGTADTPPCHETSVSFGQCQEGVVSKFACCKFIKAGVWWRPLGLDRAGTVEQDVKSTSGHRGVGNLGLPAGVLLSGESLPFRVLTEALRSG